MNDIGQRIKESREAMGLTQEQMATRSGFPPTQISHYENNKRRPSCSNLIVLCLFLHVSADYLLGLEEWAR